MLVFTRRVGEEIVIPAFDVRVKIIQIRGHKARVAISAPDDVVVHRGEIWLRICAEARTAALQAEKMAGKRIASAP